MPTPRALGAVLVTQILRWGTLGLTLVGIVAALDHGDRTIAGLLTVIGLCFISIMMTESPDPY